MKYPLIAYLDLFSNIVPLIAGLYKWKSILRNLSGAALFFTFITLGALTEVVTFWMSSQNIRNLWILHIYHLGQYTLLMSMISLWQENDMKDGSEKTYYSFLKPSVLKWSIFLYTVFWLVSKWTFERWNEPASYTQTVSTLVFILLSLFMLFQLVHLHTEGNPSILRSFRFWVTLGVLIYFAGSAVHFLVIPLTTNLTGESAINVWSIHWGVNVLVNVLYAFGFLCLHQRQTV